MPIKSALEKLESAIKDLKRGNGDGGDEEERHALVDKLTEITKELNEELRKAGSGGFSGSSTANPSTDWYANASN